MANLPFSVQPVFERLVTRIAGTGYAGSVQVGEPLTLTKESGLVTALYPRAVETSRLSLNGSQDNLSLWCRFYIPMLYQPTERREYLLLDAYFATKWALAQDTNLGGLVRNLDMGGAEGASYDGKFGYADLSGTICRVEDLSIDLTLDLESLFVYQAA